MRNILLATIIILAVSGCSSHESKIEKNIRDNYKDCLITSITVRATPGKVVDSSGREMLVEGEAIAHFLYTKDWSHNERMICTLKYYLNKKNEWLDYDMSEREDKMPR